jgi:hypothetical protein
MHPSIQHVHLFNMSITSESSFDKAHVCLIREYLSIFKHILRKFTYFQRIFLPHPTIYHIHKGHIYLHVCLWRLATFNGIQQINLAPFFSNRWALEKVQLPYQRHQLIYKDQGITAQATVKSQAFILFTHTLSIGFPQFSFVLLQDESWYG